MAITRAEFSLDLRDQVKAAGVFIQKKPLGLSFRPTSTSYLVTYKEQNGKYYLNYVRVDLKFLCDWKKRLFKNNYTMVSEVAITDRREDNVARFSNQEVFKRSMIMAEKVEDFNDVDFWGENNIIEPEESIENAIKKLSKSGKKWEREWYSLRNAKWRLSYHEGLKVPEKKEGYKHPVEGHIF